MGQVFGNLVLPVESIIAAGRDTTYSDPDRFLKAGCSYVYCIFLCVYIYIYLSM